jgi:hypothetical protein
MLRIRMTFYGPGILEFVPVSRLSGSGSYASSNGCDKNNFLKHHINYIKFSLRQINATGDQDL